MQCVRLVWSEDSLTQPLSEALEFVLFFVVWRHLHWLHAKYTTKKMLEFIISVGVVVICVVIAVMYLYPVSSSVNCSLTDSESVSVTHKSHVSRYWDSLVVASCSLGNLAISPLVFSLHFSLENVAQRLNFRVMSHLFMLLSITGLQAGLYAGSNFCQSQLWVKT